jgi:hypothetical protein
MALDECMRTCGDDGRKETEKLSVWNPSTVVVTRNEIDIQAAAEFASAVWLVSFNARPYEILHLQSCIRKVRRKSTFNDPVHASDASSA